MSTHVFDNLQINDTTTLLTGTITTVNSEMHFVPATNLPLSMDLSGVSNIRTTTPSGLSKTVFANQCTINTNTGNNAIPIFKALVRNTAFGGLKVYVTISDSNNNIQRFDEFIGIVQGSSINPPQIQQVSSICNSIPTTSNLSQILSSTSSNSVYTFTYNFPWSNMATLTISIWVEWFGSVSTVLGGASANFS